MDARPIHQERLYDDLAWLMPLISPPEDYAAEAAHWRTVLRAALGGGRHHVLELGAGGGHNFSHLTADFQATAVDLSPAMLALCRQLNPEVECLPGDMRTIRLNRTFDAVLIHDAIGYMLSETDLAAAFRTAAAHLAPGGVLVISPDRVTESFRPPEVDTVSRETEDSFVSYVECTWDPDPADTTVETLMVYLIRRPDGLQVELDRHVTGLFPRATWRRLLADAGFAVTVRRFPLAGLDRPYELYVGRRR
ncbi:MAG: class I SAM-dependent methyltransferase [Acidobacteria bacterium]|nr:class I SAM-dependent methyltransferase [Acidobacteriota bacterium]